jgi:hypothetical protein
MATNGRVVAAFLGGAVAASAVMFFLLKRTPPPPAATSTVAQATAPAVLPPAAAKPSPAPLAPAAAEPPAPAKPEAARSPVHVKRHVLATRKAAPPVTNEKEPALPPAPAIQTEPAQPDEAAMADDGQVVPAEVAPAPPHVVTLKQGTMLRVRIGETIAASARQPGDEFLATLEEPLVIDGFIIADRGAHVQGRVVEAQPSGKVKGVARLGLELARIHTTDNQWVKIRTEEYVQEGKTAKKRDLAEVIGGSGLGALIGAAAGGGPGAAIGAATGGMAGGAVVMSQRGPDATVPVETRITFRVAQPVRITEKLN